MKYLAKVAVALLLIIGYVSEVQAQVGQILWEDNFNSLNTEIWNLEVGDGCPELCGFGNQELQYYQSENVSIEEIPGEPGNFALVLEAKSESVEGHSFTSGKVTTKNNLGVKYGMVEFRIKVPDDLSTGLWPAAWMLGTNQDAEGWPRCGEMDLMEMGHNSTFRNEQEFPTATENDLVGANLIFYADDACNDQNLSCAASIAADKYYNQPYYQSEGLTGRFIVYKMYWDENRIRLTTEDNGLVQNLYTGPFPIGSESKEFRKPFYLIMNLAVGGNFTNALTDGQVTADLPGKMYIDYIRVRQWNGQGEVFTPDKLMANAGADKSLESGETLELNGSGSYGPIASYTWYINDEEVATTETHSIDLEDGSYDVKLRITNEAGDFAEDEIKVTINAPEIGEVLWEDNFNTFNADYWNIDVGDGCDQGLCGFGNFELQSYQEDNVYIEEIPEEPGNFALVLEAREEVAGNNQYTSGKVTTENKVAIQNGVVEVRMKAPNVQNGLWPAAWLLGADHGSVGWPYSGEIDMMEMGHQVSEREADGFFGSPNNFVGGNVIWYAGDACASDNLTCAASIAFDKFYHQPYTPSSGMNDRFMTYRMYWNDDVIRLVAVDNGIEHDLYTNPFPHGNVTDAFKKPFYFILNLAVGGTFTGLLNNDDISAPLPAKLYIDYVRVHEWNGEGEVFSPEGELEAIAGADQVIEDLDGTGLANVTVDGTLSYGPIAGYQWSENGVVLSEDPVADLTLSSGVHNLQLRVFDEAGNESVDIVSVDVRELLWSDEFDILDTSVWTAEVGDGCDQDLCGWGNQELQYYQEENAYIEAVPNEEGNNALVIEAKQEAVGGKSFTSARLKTEGKLSVRYGLIETRIKVPDDLSTGLWPAAWLLGTNISEVGWPYSGEIDMMEMGHRNEFHLEQEIEGLDENEVVAANLIFYSEEACSGENPNCAASISFDKYYNKPYTNPGGLTNRFLTYRLYWDPVEIRLTAVDGDVEFDLYTAPFPLGGEADEFNKPFFILLNMAVGGNFTDALTDGQVTANLPGKMLIDYVRVFRWNGHGEVAMGSGLVAHAGQDIIKLDENGDGQETVTLDGSLSANHTGEISNYSWSIDGQEIATGELAQVTLNRGTYEVLLTVSDDGGNEAIDVVQVVISNGGLAPIAEAGEDQFLQDDDGDDLVTVSLDGSASEAAGAPIIAYRWLENGEVIANEVTVDVPLSTGVHVITLEVEDDDAGIGTDEVTITIIDPDNEAPIADAGDDLTVNDDDGDDLVLINLDASASSDSDGTIEKYEWILDGYEIPNGVTSSIELSTGSYDIALVVTDDDGISNYDNLVVTVVDPDNQAPVAIAGDDFLVIDEDLDGFETVLLDATQSSDADGTIDSYRWSTGPIQLGTEPVVEVSLWLAEHVITLEVTDDDGVTSTDEITVIVNQKPTANAGEDITAVDTDMNGSEQVSLDATASNDPDGTIDDYNWIYNEVSIGTSAQLNYTFDFGPHDLLLEVTDNYGTVATDELSVYVSSTDNTAPVADAGDDITERDDDGDGFLTIQLDGSGSSDADGSIHSYKWSKEGIEVATGEMPNVTLGLGEHTLELEVTDNEGASDTDQVIVTILSRDNLALNKPTTASSEENGATGSSLAVDGDLETRWSSLFLDPQWIYVDLEGIYRIDQVVLVWEAAYGRDYEIQVSSDASTWTTVYTEDNGNGETDELNVNGAGRYVRMFGTTRGTEFGYSLFEFEVYGIELGPETDASLSDLSINGTTVSSFNSSVYEYDYIVGANDPIPTVTATPTNTDAEVNIDPAEGIPGTTTVTVTSEDGNFTSVYSINFAFEVTTNPDNLALNQPIMTSTNENAETAGANAVDGDLTTRWSSDFSDPQWIYVDLGSTYAINKVVLEWEAAYATSYEIQVSNDATNWITVFTETAGNGGEDDLSVTGTGRYVRMYGTTRATVYGYSLYEFEVYGTEAETILSTANPKTDVWTIYPNPARSSFKVELEGNFKTNKLEVLDVSGRTVIQRTIESNTTEISTNQLKPGMYFIRWTNSRFESVKRLLVVR